MIIKFADNAMVVELFPGGDKLDLQEWNKKIGYMDLRESCFKHRKVKGVGGGLSVKYPSTCPFGYWWHLCGEIRWN